MEKYDVIIAGLGAVGSAALYQLSKLGISTLGIDQFRPPHARGLSHGDTRIARQATGEGSPYAQLATRSYQIWRELEASTGSELFNQCGVLNIAGSQILLSQGEHRLLQICSEMPLLSRTNLAYPMNFWMLGRYARDIHNLR